MRSAIEAARASCVTITIVWPYESTESRTRSRISPPVFESRLPVGSSAKRIVGRVMSAREMATRCCSPPESSDGRCVAARRETRLPEQLVEPRLVRLLARDREREEDVLLRGEHRQEVEELEDEADVLAPELRQVVVAERRDLGSGDRHGAARRLVEPGEGVHERRLARAGRAHDGDELARLDVERDAAQRVDGGRALAVAAREVARFDDDVAGPRGVSSHRCVGRRHPAPQTSGCRRRESRRRRRRR